MAETLAGAGGAASPLSPFSILLLVFVLQLLDRFLEFFNQKGSKSNEEIELRQEIKKILKEASSLSTPSTFAQAAKLRRMAAAKEKELTKKQEERVQEANLSYSSYSRTLMFIKVTFYAAVCWIFWGVPVAAIPKHLLQPFGRVLSWKTRNSTNGLVMVGIIPWLVLTSRVSKFLCQKLWIMLSAK